jgi:hypothetical protein
MNCVSDVSEGTRMIPDLSVELGIELDELLQTLADRLEHSSSSVTWPFVKERLNHLIEDLKQKSENRSDRPAIEEDIAKIEEFIRRRELQRV